MAEVLRGTALALIGAQFGSEGKGVIAGKLAGEMDAAVRVGGPNAGHSLYHGGTLYKMRSIPCQWVVEGSLLYVGAGAVVNAEVLEKELASLPFPVNLTIDPLAVLVTTEHEHAEAETIRGSIGSTAEGVGEARVARLRRRGDAVFADSREWPRDVRVERVLPLVQMHLQDGDTIMLEGTQGSALSLYHGTEYPYVTSTDTNASGIASEAGIAPSDVGHVHLVARTFPIRVAGPSGPMGDELDWSHFIRSGLVAAPEQTTVTKKTRRIAEWRDYEFAKAVEVNRPCGVWLMFGDYLDPLVRGSGDVADSRAVMAFVRYLEDTWGVPVLGVGTGPVETGGRTVDFAVARLAEECKHGRVWVTA